MNQRLLLPVCVLLLGAAAPPAAGPAAGQFLGSDLDPAPPAAVRDLADRLEPIRAKHELPALGGAVVTSEGMIAAGAVGVRAAGSPEAVTVDDLWHLGSCTKAMTATLIARLVEQGTLDWNSTLVSTFAEFEESARAEYDTVTLTHLLTHRAGLPVDRVPDAIFARLVALTGPLDEQRTEAVRLSLAAEPAAGVGEQMLYSNRGYILAGAMAERATGATWEDLMREHLFGPLGMTSAGFGAPGSPDQVDQPRGHFPGFDAPQPVKPGRFADNPAVLGPAGTVHCSLADWAKFVAAHLRGARGESTLLSPQSFATLHAPFDGPGDAYAMGWVVLTRPWARGAADGDTGRVLMHNGSNGRWMCVTWLAPEVDLAVLAVTNIGGERGPLATDAAASALIIDHIKRASEDRARENANPSPRAPPGGRGAAHR